MKNKRFTAVFAVFAAAALSAGIYYICSPANRVIYAGGDNVKTVIPSGETIGIKIYAGGLTVLESDRRYDLKKGDFITEINHKPVKSAAAFSAELNASQGRALIGVKRREKALELDCTADYNESEGTYKLGIRVKDSAAGIGTLTYYDPENSSFACLGHGISETETGTLMNVASGSAVKCSVTGIRKGEKGSAGELSGVFSAATVGIIQTNSVMGVYGKETSHFPRENEPVPVADKSQIAEGDAYILATIDGTGVQKFNVEITKINTRAENNRGITLKITDERLAELTGGIVQGMSGAPIIQNGMFVGAVTHVFVNDPLKGYGIFAEYMLENSSKIQ